MGRHGTDFEGTEGSRSTSEAHSEYNTLCLTQHWILIDSLVVRNALSLISRPLVKFMKNCSFNALYRGSEPRTVFNLLFNPLLLEDSWF